MDAVETVKTLGPYLSGGLAGAMLTLAYNHFQTRRKAKSFTVKEQKIEYKLPGGLAHVERALGVPGASSFKPLRVSYDGKDYARLSYYTLKITNGPSPLSLDAPFVLSTSEATNILAHEFVTSPIPMDIRLVSEGNRGLFKFSTPPLRPGDSFELRLLLDGQSPSWHYRGTEDIKVVKDEPLSPKQKATLQAVWAAVGALTSLLTIWLSGALVSPTLFELPKGLITR